MEKLTQESFEARVDELVTQIRFYSEQYFNGASDLSDEEFDRMIDELKQLDGNNIVLLEIGAGPVSGTTVKHEIPMGSLNKITYVKDDKGNIIGDGLDDLKKWYAEHTEETVWGMKIDGLSGELIYRAGKLVEGSSRGDGVTGKSFVDHVRAIATVPTVIKTMDGMSVEDKELIIRGEFYIPNSFFDTYLVGEYANPRNAASGAMMSDEPEDVVKRGIRFLSHGLYIDKKEPFSELEKERLVNSIVGDRNGQAVGFEFVKLHQGKLTGEIIDRVDEERKKYDYSTDGIVVSINNTAECQRYGVTGRNPKGKVAWKFRPEQQETTVTEVTWQVGRTGVLTPVAELTPVLIDGSTVSRCTLHNAAEIRRLNLHIGDRVLIQKSGDIIPIIVRVLSTTEGARVPSVTNCPVCGEPVNCEDINVFCVNKSCPSRLLTRIEHYLKTINIKGIGPAIVKMMVDCGLVKDIPSLYDVKKEDLLRLTNLKEKSAGNVIDAIWSIRELDLDVFLSSLGISNMGKTTSKLLAKRFGSVSGVSSACLTDLISLDGIAENTGMCILSGWKEMKDEVDRLLAKIKVRDHQSVEGKLTGKSFCITGKLSRKRKDIEKELENHGATVKSSVGAGLDYLIAGEDAGSKIKMAEKYGVKIISEDDYSAMVG